MQRSYGLLLPEGLFDYFEVVKVERLEKTVILHLDKKVLTPEENKNKHNQFITPPKTFICLSTFTTFRFGQEFNISNPSSSTK